MLPLPILGLDLSLSATGWCFTADGSNYQMGTLKAPDKMREVDRLRYLRELLLATILKHDLRGRGVVFLEEYAFAAQGRAFGLGEWGGVARCLLADNALHVFSVSPGTLKKFVTGKGNAKKNEMLLGVFKKWGASFHSDDEADAYSLTQFGKMAMVGGMPQVITNAPGPVHLVHLAPESLRFQPARLRVQK